MKGNSGRSMPEIASFAALPRNDSNLVVLPQKNSNFTCRLKKVILLTALYESNYAVLPRHNNKAVTANNGNLNKIKQR